ncbi:hypothetical protein F5B20DRAFT_522871 [Whalleya microplaca]|nr:hypothetical protein F5B20DRAFT_522871 [Whalleya microplaca]
MSLNCRVCDRCIQKKVKCDLQRPRCSRCSEAGYSCTYSKEKRRPGPPRAARSRNQAALTVEHHLNDSSDLRINRLHDNSPCPVPLQPPLGDPLHAGALQQSMPEFNEFSLDFAPYSSATETIENPPGFQGYYLTAEQERDILIHFFDEVHTAIPFSQKGKFLRMYDDGATSRDLVVTIATVTAKILGPTSYWSVQDVELCMGALLKATAYDNDSSSAQTSLDQFRQECLLAYYNFHQSPGPPAWMRIGRLIRKAHIMGLNQIENPDLCSAFDIRIVSEDDIEDWRYIWWCVFCLDSYSNISSGSPFIIDLESINTALPKRSNIADEVIPDRPKLFLPDNVDQLWKTSQDIVSRNCVVDFNIHMVTTTILRQAGTLLRLRSERKRLYSRAAVLKNSLASLRLSLPPRYLNPARNALRSESGADHHIRLTNILHLHMTRLVISLPQDLEANETIWMDNWQQALETCQDIALVIEQWNNQFSPRVDPAICLIVFAALWISNLHRRCITDATSPLLASLRQNENILLLFLEQFSSIWALPKLLIKYYRKISADGPLTSLTYRDVDQALDRFKTPLHPKNFQPVSAIDIDITAPFENFDPAFNFADVWSFNVQDSHI